MVAYLQTWYSEKTDPQKGYEARAKELQELEQKALATLETYAFQLAEASRPFYQTLSERQNVTAPIPWAGGHFCQNTNHQQALAANELFKDPKNYWTKLQASHSQIEDQASIPLFDYAYALCRIQRQSLETAMGRLWIKPTVALLQGTDGGAWYSSSIEGAINDRVKALFAGPDSREESITNAFNAVIAKRRQVKDAAAKLKNESPRFPLQELSWQNISQAKRKPAAASSGGNILDEVMKWLQGT